MYMYVCMNCILRPYDSFFYMESLKPAMYVYMYLYIVYQEYSVKHLHVHVRVHAHVAPRCPVCMFVLFGCSVLGLGFLSSLPLRFTYM